MWRGDEVDQGNFAPDHIWFADDILGLKPNWIEKFAVLLHEADAVIPFKCLQRADLVTREDCSSACKGGMQDRVDRRGVRLAKNPRRDGQGRYSGGYLQRRTLLRTNGIEVGFFLQFGYPGETWDDVCKRH
jgi:anaerobic magnesium-protoporphyrin IX monomethyl ester cyclase